MVSFSLHNSFIKVPGCYIILACILGNVWYTLMILYAINTHQIRSLIKILWKIKQKQRGHLLIAYFNIAMD